MEENSGRMQQMHDQIEQHDAGFNRKTSGIVFGDIFSSSGLRLVATKSENSELRSAPIKSGNSELRSVPTKSENSGLRSAPIKSENSELRSAPIKSGNSELRSAPTKSGNSELWSVPTKDENSGLRSVPVKPENSELRSVPIKPANSEVPSQRPQETDEQKIENTAQRLASEILARAIKLPDCNKDHCESAGFNIFNPKLFPHGVVGVEVGLDFLRKVESDKPNPASLLPGRLQYDWQSNSLKQSFSQTINSLMASRKDDGKFEVNLALENKVVDGTVRLHLIRGLD